jgi:hypothetical protein
MWRRVRVDIGDGLAVTSFMRPAGTAGSTRRTRAARADDRNIRFRARVRVRHARDGSVIGAGNCTNRGARAGQPNPTHVPGFRASNPWSASHAWRNATRLGGDYRDDF